MILIVEDSADISGALNLLFENAILPFYPWSFAAGSLPRPVYSAGPLASRTTT